MRLVGKIASVLIAHANGGKAGSVTDPGLGAQVAEVLARRDLEKAFLHHHRSLCRRPWKKFDKSSPTPKPPRPDQ